MLVEGPKQSPYKPDLGWITLFDLSIEKEEVVPKNIREWQATIHNNAVVKGFWDDPRSIPESLCLIHSEVSECLEVYRGGHDGTIGEELADIVIRTMDLAEGLGIDLQIEMTKKHKFNITRPRMHGKKI